MDSENYATDAILKLVDQAWYRISSERYNNSTLWENNRNVLHVGGIRQLGYTEAIIWLMKKYDPVFVITGATHACGEISDRYYNQFGHPPDDFLIQPVGRNITRRIQSASDCTMVIIDNPEYAYKKMARDDIFQGCECRFGLIVELG